MQQSVVTNLLWIEFIVSFKMINTTGSKPKTLGSVGDRTLLFFFSLHISQRPSSKSGHVDSYHTAPMRWPPAPGAYRGYPSVGEIATHSSLHNREPTTGCWLCSIFIYYKIHLFPVVIQQFNLTDRISDQSYLRGNTFIGMVEEIHFSGSIYTDKPIWFFGIRFNKYKPQCR